MATNAASYNPSEKPKTNNDKIVLTIAVGEETGPVSGKPPPLSNETKAAVADAAESSATGSHVPGQDGGEKKVKSEKECMPIVSSGAEDIC